MERFLTDNSASMRFARTVFQGVIGVIAANIDIIVGTIVFDPTQRALIVALVMAVLSPVMALLKQSDTIELDDEPEDWYVDEDDGAGDEEDEDDGAGDAEDSE